MTRGHLTMRKKERAQGANGADTGQQFYLSRSR